MLYLKRKIGDSICIGDDITIIIDKVERGEVNIGIDAPRSIHIDRGEVRKKMNKKADEVSGNK